MCLLWVGLGTGVLAGGGCSSTAPSQAASDSLEHFLTAPLQPGSPTLTHLAEIPWGASVGAVRAQYAPKVERVGDGTVELLGETRMLGRFTAVSFEVDTGLGLFRGGYAIDATGDPDGVMGRVEALLRGRYPRLPSRRWLKAEGTVWRDPVNGATILFYRGGSDARPLAVLSYVGPAELMGWVLFNERAREVLREEAAERREAEARAALRARARHDTAEARRRL